MKISIKTVLCGSRERLWDGFASAMLHPAIGGVTAVLTVMAGAFASFFQKDIERCLVPWPFYETGTFSLKASVFWLTVFAVGLVLMGVQWAQGRETRRNRHDLEGAIHRIESLPPEGFLAEYQKLLRTAARSVLIGIEPGTRPEDRDLAIRNVLQAILGVVRTYDMPPAGARYAANVMLHREHGPVEARNPVGFVAHVPGHPDYDGWLELVRTLSTSDHEAPGAPDTRVAELVVPVPRNIRPVRGPNLSDLHPVLPGAAWAFVHLEFAGFDTIGRLDDWLRERCAASEGEKESIRGYFRQGGPGEAIRSFASMPILAPGAAGEALRPMGVLNLHSDYPGLAAERGGDRLSPLLEPFRMMLSILLALRGAYSAAPSGETP